MVRSWFQLRSISAWRYRRSHKPSLVLTKELVAEKVDRISVVIDATQNCDLTAKTVASLSRQTLVPTDVVVVGTGDAPADTDSSALRLRHVKCSNAKLAPHNLGVVAATSEWVLLLQAGDSLIRDDLIAGLLGRALARDARLCVLVENPAGVSATSPAALLAGPWSKGIRLCMTKGAAHRILGTRKRLPAEPAYWVAAATAKALGISTDWQPLEANISLTDDVRTIPDREHIDEIARELERQVAGSRPAQPGTIGLASTPRQRPLRHVATAITWFAAARIGVGEKLGRSRDLMVAGLARDRPQVARLLREMRDDVSRGRHPEYLDLIPRDKKSIRVLIICRDLLSPLKELLSWLEQHEFTDIVMLDNDSSYPPLLEFFATTRYQVVPLGRNIGTQAPWVSLATPLLVFGTYYIVTDPDILPVEDCPPSFLDHWFGLHEKYPSFLKVGFGLKIDDLPEHFLLKDKVRKWEGNFWRKQLEEDVYDAAIDTTFALYKPGTYDYFTFPSIRTGGRHVARHLPWYVDNADLSEEDAYYREHRSMTISSWTDDELPERFERQLEP